MPLQRDEYGRPIIPPGQDPRYYQDYQEQDEEYQGEYTINDEINPEDLIKTMGVVEIDKFIPKRPFVHLVKKNTQLETDTCTICLDFIKNGTLLREIPLCKHVFHAECLLSWLQVNEICPNCKNEVSIYTLRAYFDSVRHSKKEKKKEESSKMDQSSPGMAVNQSLEVIHTRFNPRTTANPSRNVSRVNVEDNTENVGIDWNYSPQPLESNSQANRSFRRG